MQIFSRERKKLQAHMELYEKAAEYATSSLHKRILLRHAEEIRQKLK